MFNALIVVCENRNQIATMPHQGVILTLVTLSIVQAFRIYLPVDSCSSRNDPRSSINQIHP